MTATSIRLAYGSDKVLEISSDTTDFFLDGKRGNFSSVRHRDFLLAVAKVAPKTASYRYLETELKGRGELRDQFKKWVNKIKERIEAIGLKVPLLEAVRSDGYHLATGWSLVDSEVKPKHIAHDLFVQLRTTLESTCTYVDTAAIRVNPIGLLHVERTALTNQLTRDNYLLIEDIGWQLFHVLSSCGVTNDDHPAVLDVKKKIEKLISYALMWRIGDSITEEKFRRDFRTESMALLEGFNELIDRILVAAEQRKASLIKQAE
jgi:hypothetical protein